MAVQMLQNCGLHLEQYALASYLNMIRLETIHEPLDCTTFGNSARRRKKGLGDHTIEGEGYVGIADTDAPISALLGLDGKIISVAPVSVTAGQPAYSMKTYLGEYRIGAAVGELHAFTLNANASGEVSIKGTIMEASAKASTAAGTARQLGAVAADKKVYGVMHVTAVSGTSPTLDLVIQSDDAEGMGSPTTRLTFAQATAASAQWLTPVAGPITDDWWRASWTVGGSAGPSFTILVIVAIQ